MADPAISSYRAVFISDVHLGTKGCQAEMRDIDGIAYVNDGDWVESCSALVEHHDGALEIVRWAERRSWSAIDRAVRSAEPAEPLPATAAAAWPA